MAKIPCINCICLPICKADAVTNEDVTFFHIRRKCVLVEQFLTAKGLSTVVRAERVSELYNFMVGGPKTVVWDSEDE